MTKKSGRMTEKSKGNDDKRAEMTIRERETLERARRVGKRGMTEYAKVKRWSYSLMREYIFPRSKDFERRREVKWNPKD